MTVKNAIFNFAILVTALALPVQFFIDPSIENIACTCIVFASSLVVLLYLRETSALQFYPLSTFSLLGFCVSSQLGALLVQTSALTALRSFLYDPIYTFGTLALYQVIAVAMHVVYRFFSVTKPTNLSLMRGVFDWAGIYRTPGCGALWCMGLFGLPTFLLWGHEGVAGRIASGFSFLVWAPFLIPFYIRNGGKNYCNARLNRVLLTVYSLMIVVFGLALNARAIMLEGLVTIALIYLLAGMRSNAPVKRQSLIRLGWLVVILIAVSGPVSDLATSMAIVRHARGKIPAAAMIQATLRMWRQPHMIAAYRADQALASRYSAYDEHYITNPMLARMVETKFYDNSFHFAQTLTTEKSKRSLRDISLKFALAGLPSPMLDALGIPIDKDDLNYSMGDYLAYLSRGIPLGGRKTGNMFAQGIALFGPLFPFLYAVICLALFSLMDLLAIQSDTEVVPISALGMLEIWGFFMGGITYESLHKVLHFFVRNFPQTVVIYVFVFASTRLLPHRKPVQVAPLTAPMWQRSV